MAAFGAMTSKSWSLEAWVVWHRTLLRRTVYHRLNENQAVTALQGNQSILKCANTCSNHGCTLPHVGNQIEARDLGKSVTDDEQQSTTPTSSPLVPRDLLDFDWDRQGGAGASNGIMAKGTRGCGDGSAASDSSRRPCPEDRGGEGEGCVVCGVTVAAWIRMRRGSPFSSIDTAAPTGRIRS